MLNRPDKAIRTRLAKLEAHLENENPLLLQSVARFKKLDRVAYRMGLLETTETYTARIPWWPLISVLGTFSAGKSSFINQFLGSKLQHTGNQAVDDKFTVVCYSTGEDGRVLPGVALDSDPRFPFYQMSDEINKVAAGEGKRIDAYLQMKTSGSEKLSGKIIIDSPGFDADEQRNAILRLTDHIVNLSDLVLVFFDARHPEPGAMQDTLEHLVGSTIVRGDSEKFLYILNQIDTAAQEDNPEAVVAAWHRALAAKGLTAGRFYTIYNEQLAVPIKDEAVRARFANKRDRDLAAINERIHQVGTERAYRIIGVLQNIAEDIEHDAVPLLMKAMHRWRRLVVSFDALVFGSVFTLLLVISHWFSPWFLFHFDFTNQVWLSVVKLAVLAGFVLVTHNSVRRMVARQVAKKLPEQHLAGNIKQAFIRNTQFFRSIFQPTPLAWSWRTKRVLHSVIADASGFIQTMNDRFTNPSGRPVKIATPVIKDKDDESRDEAQDKDWLGV
jgi:ribosome biogenesis GTPase A